MYRSLPCATISFAMAIMASILSACSTLPPSHGPIAQTVGFIASGTPHLSIQADEDKLSISYQDYRTKALMLAACGNDCTDPKADWQVVRIEAAGLADMYTSLQRHGSRSLISYHDYLSGDLKLATCLAACASKAAAWQITTVDKGGFVGGYTSLRLNDGKPVISYYDQRNQSLKLATCLANCSSSEPRWQIVTVDSGEGGLGTPPSMQLHGGKPVISYYKHKQGSLKLATCLDQCATSGPSWRILTIDAKGDVGEFASLQLNGDKPVISYRDVRHGTLKLATCTGLCASNAPIWVISTIETASTRGFTSLQISGGVPIVGFYDGGSKSLRVVACSSDCASSSPVWRNVHLDHGRFSGAHASLQLSAGKAIVAYYDLDHGAIKYAMADLSELSGSSTRQ